MTHALKLLSSVPYQMDVNPCPQVFRPTMAEFAVGFEKYLATIEDSLKMYGICKVGVVTDGSRPKTPHPAVSFVSDHRHP